MTDLFRGFFTRVSDAVPALPVVDATLRQWWQARVRLISEPFSGIAVQLADKTEDVFEENEEELEADVLAWSKNFPETKFVFVDAEPFGGACLYQGYVCCNGRILAREDTEEFGYEPLLRLLHCIDVVLDEPATFAPFERGFFDYQTLPISPSMMVDSVHSLHLVERIS